ncbi:MAG: DegV family protein [Clostridia bacterium]|nr:DegV family protein [Clostridia bacterium]
MANIRITSDSTCDLHAISQKRNIGIFPFQIILDSQSYFDGVDITPQDIFNFVEETKILPKTSAPSVGDYEEFFEKELKGYDCLIHFNISSKSSGSHNFAVEASKKFDGKVFVVDSKALSTGQGLLVLEAADMRDAGKSAEEIVAAVNEIRDRINTSFIPDSLDYLHKGGRVSGMVKVVAGLFKIHPLIYMNDGQLVPGEKYRGKMTQITKQYVQNLKEKYPTYDKRRCFITHSTAERDVVDAMKEAVQAMFEFDEIIETVAGSVITSHCGKGTIGVLFIYE